MIPAIIIGGALLVVLILALCVRRADRRHHAAWSRRPGEVMPADESPCRLVMRSDGTRPEK